MGLTHFRCGGSRTRRCTEQPPRFVVFVVLTAAFAGDARFLAAVGDLWRWAKLPIAMHCHTGVDSLGFRAMKAEFTAIIEPAPEGGFWAVCAEVPGANGQGETLEEAKESLRDAIRLIFEDRMADLKRGLPENAIQTTIAIE